MNTPIIGLKHHMATVPFEDIELMRRLHEDGMRIKEIAEKFEQKPDTVRQWVAYRGRINA